MGLMTILPMAAPRGAHVDAHASVYGGLTLIVVALMCFIQAMIVYGAFGGDIPAAQDHLDFFPARFLAVVANVTGTLAVLAVALVTIRRRPVGNALIVGGVVVAAAGTALSGLGAAQTAVFVAIAALLLYGGFTASSPRRP
jgi:hypothetical protein